MNKIMWVVRGTGLAKVWIGQETDKTYTPSDIETMIGYVSGVWPNIRVRKSDGDKKWFDNPKDALACLLDNQRHLIVRLQDDLEKAQARLQAEKERLAEWEAQHTSTN